MMNRNLLWLVICAVLSACGDSERVDPPEISLNLQEDLDSWLSENGRDPADYLLGLFEDHDVVLIGEFHRIRHDAEFVGSLLPRLHEAGVRVFAMEFARREDQQLIDSLLAGPTWDEDLAREIQFRMFMPWAFREYVDILKAGWSTRRAGGDLRIIGVNNSVDFSQFKSEADWDDVEARRRAYGGQTEADWAEAVLAQVTQGEKVLVYSGINHAFTGFRQPRVEDGKFQGFVRVRMGNVLRKELGECAVTVFLHSPWHGAEGYGARTVHPAGGRLDAFMLEREGGPFPVGFDVAASPLSDLPIEDAVYMHGYDHFTLADFCDGWIYFRPMSECEPVDYIEGWIHEGNVERARAVAMNPRWRRFDVEQFDLGCRSYLDDHALFFDHLR